MKTFRRSLEDIINDIKAHPTTKFIRFQIWQRERGTHTLCFLMYDHKPEEVEDKSEMIGIGKTIAEDYNYKLTSLRTYGEAIIVILKRKFPNIEFEFDAITNLFEELSEVS